MFQCCRVHHHWPGALPAMVAACVEPLPLYRPRDPQASDLWRLLEQHFETFRQVYDERFAAKYGFWRPIVERSVTAFLKCGDLHQGFARVRCPDCHHPLVFGHGSLVRCSLSPATDKRPLPQGEFLELPELDLEQLRTAWQEAVFALFLAEFTQHIPPKGAHLIRGHRPKVGRGWYSNKSRGLQRKQAEAAAAEQPGSSAGPAAEPAPVRTRASQTWAMLIKRVFEIAPLICPRCSGQMKIVAFLEPPQGDVIPFFPDPDRTVDDARGAGNSSLICCRKLPKRRQAPPTCSQEPTNDQGGMAGSGRRPPP